MAATCPAQTPLSPRHQKAARTKVLDDRLHSNRAALRGNVSKASQGAPEFLVLSIV